MVQGPIEEPTLPARAARRAATIPAKESNERLRFYRNVNTCPRLPKGNGSGAPS